MAYSRHNLPQPPPPLIFLARRTYCTYPDDRLDCDAKAAPASVGVKLRAEDVAADHSRPSDSASTYN